MSYTIRILNREDASAYQAVRLRALQEHPEAFGSSYEEEVSRSLELVGERLAANHPYQVMFGAFVDGTLVGTLHFFREERAKKNHRVNLGAMYVAPEARSRGIGRALIEAVIAHARTQTGIRHIILAVTVGNHAARYLYRSAGFVSWGIDPDYIRVGELFYDIEWMALRLE